MIKATDLAYGRLGAPDLDRMEEFLVDFGMVRADRTKKALYMRGTDGDHHHIHVTELGDPTHIGLAWWAKSEEDLEITQKENSLVIYGKARQGNDEVSYLHQGIASRAFERNFDLADYVKVSGANIENGMLTVDLERELPEALKPRKIAIKNGPANGLVDKAKKLLGADEPVAA